MSRLHISHLDVQVRSRLDEHLGHVEVVGVRRLVERGLQLVILRVQVGACLQQRLHHVQVARSRGVVQGGVTFDLLARRSARASPRGRGGAPRWVHLAHAVNVCADHDQVRDLPLRPYKCMM